MRRDSFIIVGLLAAAIGLLSLIPTAMGESSTVVWREDFDHGSLSEMTSAGWTIGNAAETSLGGGQVSLGSSTSNGASIVFDGLPDGIVDWTVEANCSWIGGSVGSLMVSVGTTTHSYAWWGDGYYGEFVFSRDGVKVMKFSGYAPQMNTGCVLKMDKVGNNFNLFFNGELKRTFTETGETGVATSVSTIGPWHGQSSYDWIELRIPNAVSSTPAPGFFDLSNPWFVGGIVVIIGGLAGAGLILYRRQRRRDD